MPKLGNIFVYPQAKVLTDKQVSENSRQMEIEVTGLICYSL